MPHFQLVTTDGDALGPIELDGPDWPAGRVIYTGPNEPNLRVVDVLATEDDDDPERFTCSSSNRRKTGGGREALGSEDLRHPPQEADRPLEPRAVRGRWLQLQFSRC